MTYYTLKNNINVKLEKVFDDAQSTGEILIVNRLLKKYPDLHEKYDLTDVLSVDVTNNRFTEIPDEIFTLRSLETLNVSRNIIKLISPKIIALKNLTYLNLNRNLLTHLPLEICELANLEVLLISNNRLVSLPEEMCFSLKLMKLDVSRNKLTQIPAQLGQMSSLQSLNLSRNSLVEIPISLSMLNLRFLDISSNRISQLPTELGRMEGGLEMLFVHDNPLVSPPANVCSKGMVFILKTLNREKLKIDRRKSFMLQNSNVANGNTTGNDNSNKGRNILSTVHTANNNNKERHNVNLNTMISYTSKDLNIENLLALSSSSTSSSLPPYQPLNVSKVVPPSPEIQNGIFQALTASRKSTQNNINSANNTRPPVTNNNNNNNNNNSNNNINNNSNTNFTINSNNNNKVYSRQNSSSSCTGENTPRLLSTGAPNISTGAPITGSTGVPIVNMGVPNDLQVNQNTGLPAACIRGLEQLTLDLEGLQPGFTVKRSMLHAREDREAVDAMRKALESKLKIRLPVSMDGCLKDGVVLCHLVNELFPGTIPLVHVPRGEHTSLSITRCRSNIDFFINACHRLGLEKSRICSLADILSGNLAMVAKTVLLLVESSRC